MNDPRAYENLKDLIVEDSLISGYVTGENEYINFITNLKGFGYDYFTRRSFSKYNEPARLFFHLDMGHFKIPFLGSPFQVIKGCEMECTQGPIRPGRSKAKLKGKQIKELADHPLSNKEKNPPTKIGCPAKFCVKCIRIYTDYKIAEFKKGSRQQHKLMTKIKDDMLDPKKKWIYEDRFYVIISTDKIHSHPIKNTIPENINVDVDLTQKTKNKELQSEKVRIIPRRSSRSCLPATKTKAPEESLKIENSTNPSLFIEPQLGSEGKDEKHVQERSTQKETSTNEKLMKEKVNDDKIRLKSDIYEQMGVLSKLICTATDSAKMETLVSGLRKLVEACTDSPSTSDETVPSPKRKRSDR